MELLVKAIILGIVEGVTEFLPISSTGHLIIVNQFINFTGDFATMFDVVIQLGAILSVIVYFWDRLYPFSSQHSLEQNKEIWITWKKAVIGVLPALVIGGTLGHKVEEYLFNPVTVALALFLGGILLIIVERRKATNSILSITELSNTTVIAIGLFQCLAMIPGTSRAAATIIGAMILGASRVVAAEFSFFLAIPTMVAASGYSLRKHGLAVSPAEWTALAVGFIVSFLVAWGVIAFFMNYIRKHDFTFFAYYRIVLAVAIGILMYFKILPMA
ncbi:MAG: undecaprenyl-diphosphate phosphatase [bacterium]